MLTEWSLYWTHWESGCPSKMKSTTKGHGLSRSREEIFPGDRCEEFLCKRNRAPLWLIYEINYFILEVSGWYPHSLFLLLVIGTAINAVNYFYRNGIVLPSRKKSSLVFHIRVLWNFLHKIHSIGIRVYIVGKRHKLQSERLSV